MQIKKIFEALILISKGEFKSLKSKIIIKYGNREMLFTEFYKTNTWGSLESISGPGSELKYTKSIINALPILLKTFNIQSINDAPCGDFNFLKHVSFENIRYYGFDIVKELIEVNKMKYGASNINFFHLDVLNEIMPYSDLILSRDMFIHFSFADTSKAIQNFKNSGSLFLLTNTYPDIKKNLDIKTGCWRPINLEIEPYNFSPPLFIIKEYQSSDHGLKNLSLYKLN
jgi:hypothetical protein